MVSTIKRNELIKCRECEYEFGEDEADICRKCHSHICPKCKRCLCARLGDTFTGFRIRK